MKFRPSKPAPGSRPDGETPKPNTPTNTAGPGPGLDGWDDKTLAQAAAGEAKAAAAVGPIKIDLPGPEPEFDGKGGFVTAYGVRRAPDGGFEVVRFFIDGRAVVREEIARQPEPYVASAYSYTEKAVIEEYLAVSAGRRVVP